MNITNLLDYIYQIIHWFFPVSLLEIPFFEFLVNIGFFFFGVWLFCFFFVFPAKWILSKIHDLASR